MKDGKVFGVPCYAVDEIYYTFADASQLKEICQGGGFRLTDETEYYYNYARSSKEILNAVTANDKITVIDHDGDNAFDVVLVTTSRPSTLAARATRCRPSARQTRSPWATRSTTARSAAAATSAG